MAPDGGRHFRFGRRSRTARAGETLLSALSSDRWPSLARSLRYHRPRGPLCGVGHCTGCLVRVNGVPNVRSCRYPVKEGDRVVTENAWPSPRFDLYGALDVLFPHGVDSVHGFRRPAWAAPLYQRFVRHLAGFGRAPSRSAVAPPPAPRALAAEVTIVGAGRAGRAVAAALVRRGVRPIVVERGPMEAAADGGPLPGCEAIGSTTVTVLPAPTARDTTSGPDGLELLGSGDDGRGVRIRSRSVVLATGGYDAALLFEGSDRPGVVTADLALSDLGLPLGETVVFGGSERARRVVERLGDQVVAVVAPGEIAPELALAAVDAGVPLYPRSRVVRSVGRAHVRGLELARRDGSGRFRLSCRSVVLAHRRLPNAQLAFQAGGARRWADVPGAYFPTVDALGRSDVSGVFVVGSAARPAHEPSPTPEQVAGAVLGGAEVPSSPPPARAYPSEIIPYYRELLRERRRGKWVLCACEDVLLEELERAVERGYRGLELGMRYTGVGTGLCQGRYCLPEAIAVLAVLEGRPPPEVGVVTQRPPLEPTSLGTLAGLAPGDREEPRP